VRRLAAWGTAIVLADLVLVTWHLFVLGGMHPEMTTDQLVRLGGVVSLLPVVAAILLWTPRRRVAVDPSRRAGRWCGGRRLRAFPAR
jgi:hypothetical protein